VKARILYLTNRFAPAGAETFLLSRLRVVDRSRFEPYVGAVRAGGALQPAFEATGVPTLTFGEGKRFDAGAFTALYSFLKRERITILEAHVWWACLVARVVGRAAGVPIIITNEQDMRAGESTHRKDVLIAGDLTTRLSDACVHITRAAERSFRETTPAILQGHVIRRLIPNGTDTRKVAGIVASTARKAKRASLGIPEDAVVIGNVARLHPAKGLPYLLQAFAKVLATVPNAHLVLVGWGDSEAELRGQAKELGVDQRVHFLGKRLDVYELLATFDVFAFSSVHEGQGIAILEAMAAGVPIVSTDVDGIPDMVRHERTGLAVPPRDAEALAAGVLRVLQDRALAAKIVEGARRVVEDEFSVEAVGRAYDALYEELLARAGISLAAAA
jgi:glycosyltransferase involved in cell wall biosynthesis